MHEYPLLLRLVRRQAACCSYSYAIYCSLELEVQGFEQRYQHTAAADELHTASVEQCHEYATAEDEAVFLPLLAFKASYKAWLVVQYTCKLLVQAYL